MKKLIDLFDTLNKKYFSNDKQLTRIVILIGIVLLLGAASFGGYYWYDRYYQVKSDTMQVSLVKAEEAVRNDPTNINLRMNLAESYMVQKRFDDSLNQLNQVMAINPKNQRAWYLEGVTFALKGDYTSAIEPLQKFYDAAKSSDMQGINRPLQATAYYLGISYLKTGQPDKAVPVLEQNLQWSPTDADNMYELGVALSDTKQYDQALKVLYHATAFVPDYVEVYQEMALIFQQTNQPALVLYANGMVNYCQKNYDQALNLLLQSSQQQPSSAPTFIGLGLVYEMKKDYQNAQANYTQALALDPNDVTAQKGQARVQILLTK